MRRPCLILLYGVKRQTSTIYNYIAHGRFIMQCVVINKVFPALYRLSVDMLRYVLYSYSDGQIRVSGLMIHSVKFQTESIPCKDGPF
jgi:hypothetical protein